MFIIIIIIVKRRNPICWLDLSTIQRPLIVRRDTYYFLFLDHKILLVEINIYCFFSYQMRYY